MTAAASRARPDGVPPWDWASLAYGALAGVAALGAVALAYGVAAMVAFGVLGIVATPFIVVGALVMGAPTLLVVGTPCAAAAWSLLRPIRREWVHVLLFGMLGALVMLALGAGVTLMVATTTPEPSTVMWISLALLPFAVVPSVTARLVAGECARRAWRASQDAA